MDKASPDLSGYDDWIDRLLASMPLERRIGGLDSEEGQAALDRLLASIPVERRLAGLDPEEVARTLPAEYRVLALPDDALAALSPEYVATLPDAVQAAVRERLRR